MLLNLRLIYVNLSKNSLTIDCRSLKEIKENKKPSLSHFVRGLFLIRQFINADPKLLKLITTLLISEVFLCNCTPNSYSLIYFLEQNITHDMKHCGTFKLTKCDTVPKD